jgi:hypothetical protein
LHDLMRCKLIQGAFLGHLFSGMISFLHQDLGSVIF